jgi:hypothetical protein
MGVQMPVRAHELTRPLSEPGRQTPGNRLHSDRRRSAPFVVSVAGKRPEPRRRSEVLRGLYATPAGAQRRPGKVPNRPAAARAGNT